MDLHIHIEKKHFYFITGLIVLMFGFFIVNASYEEGVFHYLSDVVDANHKSIDLNADGLVDRAENASFAEIAGSLDASSIDVNSVSSSTLNVDTICLNGDCRTTWPEESLEEIWLVNSLHTTTQCNNSDGEVLADGSGNEFCKFNAGSCPNGWYQYQEWRTQSTQSRSGDPSCPNYKGGFWVNSYCYCADNYIKVLGASWDNTAQHSCKCGSLFTSSCGIKAGITQVGCY
ncbi:hypothetical protein K9L16_01645 [Candidatus Pacearchaeota archaeon]|nr:hypothetical protein [Candidatus Pacearchaeota archaeon]